MVFINLLLSILDYIFKWPFSYRMCFKICYRNILHLQVQIEYLSDWQEWHLNQMPRNKC